MAMTADTDQPVGTTPERPEATPEYRPESPFAEASPPPGPDRRLGAEGFTSWTEAFSPFTEAPGAGPSPNAELEALAGDVMEDLYDEAFDQAVAGLVAETAEAVDERLAGEAPAALAGERLRLGDSHLEPIGFEAEQYLDRLATGIAGVDVASLTDQQVDELFEQFDEATAAVSPAGEEFIKAIKRKARQAVAAVKKVATAAAKVAAPLLGPVLARLKRFVRPLLRRVLAMAINRLPAPLQEPARALARRFGAAEAEAEADPEAELEGANPVAVGDPEAVAEDFDALVAEAVVAGAAGPGLPATEGLGEAEYEFEAEFEGTGGGYGARAPSSPLEALAEARTALTEALADAGDGEDVTPAVEQFVPALLPLLRTGIRLVGRPRVVNFLAGAMGGLISQWVGPQHARPLSAAIVDTGLRLAGLERPEPTAGAGAEAEAEHEAGPAVLAAVVEDTVRRVAELEDEVLEDEALLPLAVGEAFAEAAAAHVPAQFLRPGLAPAPTLAGSLVPRHPRQAYAYKKYSVIPEVEITEAVARSVRTFGGATLAAALRAAGRTLPLRARVHLYEATVGTSLRKLAALERVPGLGPGRPGAMAQLHPLTPQAAGLLLREPRLGTRTPAPFLRSRYRIAVGQRFYYLEPARGVQASPAGVPGTSNASAAATRPSRSTVTVDLPKGEVRAALYFSEAEAQAVASALARQPGGPALVTPVLAAYEDATGSLGQPTGQSRFVADAEGEGERARGGAGPQRRIAPAVLDPFARRLRTWGRATLARWARGAAPEFRRAAQSPGPGVTVVVHLRGVPGLDVLRRAAAGRLAGAELGRATSGAAFRGAPSAGVSVRAGTPGRAGR